MMDSCPVWIRKEPKLQLRIINQERGQDLGSGMLEGTTRSYKLSENVDRREQKDRS